jgi:hypothetical protein
MPDSANRLKVPSGFSMKRHFSAILTAHICKGCEAGFVFLFYDALFTVVGALVTFLILVAALLAGLVLWRFAERKRPLKQT